MVNDPQKKRYERLVPYNSTLLDIVTCKIKYEEGFVPIEGKILTKPESLWSTADRDLVIPTGKKKKSRFRRVDLY